MRKLIQIAIMTGLMLGAIGIGFHLEPFIYGQEVITLSEPIVATPSATVMRVARVEFNVLLGTFQVTVLPWTAGAFVVTAPQLNVTYNSSTTPTGASLIVSLNKQNLSTISLEKRILNQLVASGFITGAVSGTVP